MHYAQTIKGVFLSRPNRFIAYVDINGSVEKCHVKNTGRCRELLIPGTVCILEYHPDAQALGRKTSYSLIAVYKDSPSGTNLINMDSQAPNQAVWEWLQGCPEHRDISGLRREVTYRNSRFDLAFHQGQTPAFMEVKGVTLEKDGQALFPDAPTKRGIRHIKELIASRQDGYNAYILFVIQMKQVNSFSPNAETHPAFGEALLEAALAGVEILAYDCIVTEKSLVLDQPIPVRLKS